MNDETVEAMRQFAARHWFFCLLQLATATYLTWSIYRTPAPGYAIGLLGVLAAAMSIHIEMRGWQKAIWMLLIGGALLIEFRAINEDRLQHEQEAQEVRKYENDRFESIAKGIESSIERSQEQFNSTMARMNRVLSNVTGGNSYAVILPDTFGQEKELPLMVENHGEDVLTGVWAMITPQGAYAGKVPQFILEAVNNRLSIGTLGPEERQWTSNRLLPDSLAEFEEKGEKFRRAFVSIYAQNFSAEEYLDLKRRDGRWTFRYSIYRNPSKREREVIIRTKGAVLPKTKLEAIDWTDSLNDLKKRHE